MTTPRLNKLCPVFMIRPDELLKKKGVQKMGGLHLILFSMGNIITCECKIPTKSSYERHRSVIIDKTSRIYMGVSKNRGTPKWMVYNGKPYCLMDDFEGTNIFGNTHLDLSQSFPILISQ